MDVEMLMLQLKNMKHWIRLGFKEFKYPTCCILWFVFFPHSKFWSKYVLKYNKDGYVPCPVCLLKNREL